eukprot:214647-Chlamydomonas_euryale.AAC.3
MAPWRAGSVRGSGSGDEQQGAGVGARGAADGRTAGGLRGGLCVQRGGSRGMRLAYSQCLHSGIAFQDNRCWCRCSGSPGTTALASAHMLVCDIAAFGGNKATLGFNMEFNLRLNQADHARPRRQHGQLDHTRPRRPYAWEIGPPTSAPSVHMGKQTTHVRAVRPHGQADHTCLRRLHGRCSYLARPLGRTLAPWRDHKKT